jgi:hypothetical protein
MSRQLKCVNSPASFCYICGKYFVTRQLTQLRLITNEVCELYNKYFKMVLCDNTKSWAPDKACNNCVTGLKNWKKLNTPMPFGVPMIWREPSSHPTECYFCSINTVGISSKNKSSLVYPNLESAIRPQPHLPVEPIPSSREEELDVQYETSEGSPNSFESEIQPFKPITNDLLDDMVRNFGMSKRMAIEFGRTSKSLGHLDPTCTFYRLRNREAEFLPFFSEDNGNLFCSDIK